MGTLTSDIHRLCRATIEVRHFGLAIKASIHSNDRAVLRKVNVRQVALKFGTRPKLSTSET